MDFGFETVVAFSPQRQAERALRQYHGLPGRHQDKSGQSSGQVKDLKRMKLEDDKVTQSHCFCTSFLT